MPYLKLYINDPSSARNIVPLIEEFKWSENDLDSPNAGRALDGKMYRGLTASKRRCDIKLLPCEASVLNQVFEILRHEYFFMDTDLCPANDPIVGMEMYNSTRSAGVAIITTDNVIKHKDASFNIIQR